MSKLDEELIDRLTNAQKPVFVDPNLFAGLAKNKIRRERMKRVTALVSVLGIVGLGAAGFALANRGRSSAPASTGTSSVVLPNLGTVGASIPGVPFPACHVSIVPGYESDVGAIYMFARGSRGSPCPDVANGNAYLARYRTDLPQRGSEPQIMGPIECFQGCRIFGSPNIDGVGYNELAIVVADGGGFDRVELYSAHPGTTPPFTPITTTVSGERTPVSFDWFAAADHRAGAACPTSANDVLDVWHAVKRGGNWHVVQQFLRINGSRVIESWTGRYSTGLAAALPPGGETDFCGASVTP